MNFFVIGAVNKRRDRSSSYTSREQHLHMHGSKKTFVKLSRTRLRFPSHLIASNPDVFHFHLFVIYSNKHGKLRWKFDKNKKRTKMFSRLTAREMCKDLQSAGAGVARMKCFRNFAKTNECLEENLLSLMSMNQASRLDHRR